MTAWLVGRAGFQLDRYEDRAVGKVAKNERGTNWVSEVTLNPIIFDCDELLFDDESRRAARRPWIRA